MVDREETVLIVGKGPSFRQFEYDGKVACLNGAVNYYPEADWLFVNDLSAFEEINPSSLETVGTIVLPTWLHCDVKGKVRVPHEAAPVDSEKVSTYCLHTAPEKSLPYFGRIMSVGETAVCWLLHCGYRSFDCVGLDSKGGYHANFNGGQQVAKPKRHFKENWKRIEDRVLKAGGEIRRI